MHHCSESLLNLLRNFLQHPKLIKQIHTLLITESHLLTNSHNPSPSKWKPTLLYNSLLRAYLSIGSPHTILLFTQLLAHQVVPNSHTFTSLLKSASSSGLMDSFSCSSLHVQAFKRGALNDPFVGTSLLGLYAKLGDLRDARKVFDEIPSRCVVACNAMLDAFGRNGDMGSAVLLFGSMAERDVVSWTSIINGLMRNGCFGEGIRVFKQMMNGVSATVIPNEATYVTVLSCCANLDGESGLCKGKQIHGYIVRNLVLLTVFLGTALVDFYGKLGCLGIAMRIFDQMVVREVCSWNAIMTSLACNSREEEALDMFERMKLEGHRPNEVTFVAILTACARTKRVGLGLKLFQLMGYHYKVKPRMEHYGCMVDLLGRAGLLDEAKEIIMTMPFEPDASVLGALLGAYRIHGAIEPGKEMERRILESQPQQCGLYVALSNINAEVNRWHDTAGLRDAMADAGIKKTAAYSSVRTHEKPLPNVPVCLSQTNLN